MSTPTSDEATEARPLSTKRKVVFAAATTIAFFVLLLGGGELGLRGYARLKFGVPGKSYGIYDGDPELGATHRPHSYNANATLNNWGFRNDADLPEKKPPRSLRVYTSGGSTTFCYNLNNYQSWPSVLERRLRALPEHADDEVANGGQIATPLSSGLILAKRFVPRLRPDVVIFYAEINEGLNAGNLARREHLDLDDLLRQHRWGVVSKELDQGRWLKRNSALVKFYDYFMAPLRQTTATNPYLAEEPPPWALKAELHPWVTENLEHTFREYVAFLKAHQTEVIVVRYGDVMASSWNTRMLRGWRDRLVEIGRAEGAMIVDMVPVVERHPRPKDLFVVGSGVHVTAEGAELVAEELSKAIVKRFPTPPG
jgi:lysophospholipase L1-like esterase